MREPEHPRCGPYLLAERIGVGGMAEVFRARDNESGQWVAVKRLLPHLADSTYSRAFLDEARTLAAVTHPNIVQVYDVGMQSMQYYMAMEWLVGWDLAQLVNRARERGEFVPVPIVVRLAIDAARGLHAAHSATTAEGSSLGIIHRDISPQNLFLTERGIVKLLDFGVAKSALQLRETTDQYVIKGKLGYMSPEQYLGEPLDGRSDIFSLGVVLHEMLTAERLFCRRSPIECCRAVVHEPVPRPYRTGEELPSDLVQITMRAIERDRAFRPPTAEALADALEEVLVALDTACHQEEVRAYSRRLFPRRRDSVIAAMRTGTEIVEGVAPHRTALDQTTPDLAAVVFWARRLGQRFRSLRVVATAISHFPWRGRKAVVAFGTLALGLMLLLHLVPSSPLPGKPAPFSAPTQRSMPVAIEAPGRSAEAGPVEPMTMDDASGPVEPVAMDDPSGPVAMDDASGPAEPVAMDDPSGPVEPMGGPSGPAGPEARDEPSAPDEPAESRRSRRPTPANRAKHARRPERSALSNKPQKQARGTLTLQTVPWANVFINGKPVGPTPIIKRSVLAGKLKVRLVNPDLGISTTRTITVPPGELVKQMIELK